MKKKKFKKKDLILILIFLATIAIPGAMLFQNAGAYLEGENRMAASFPELIKEDGRLATKTEIESFFNDNIGFRTTAPMLDQVAMYSVFGKLLNTDELMGKDGNLFAGDDSRFPARRAPYPPLTETELAENGRNIQAVSDYFETKDIPFLFITIPNKEEVYPDLYPDTFVQKPDQGRLEQQVEWLNEHTDVDAYDMTAVMREKAARHEEMLWHETADNAHWNYWGAWYGYSEIMGRLQAYDSELYTISLDDFEVSESVAPYTGWDGKYVYGGLYNTTYTFDYKPGFMCEQIGNGSDPWMPQEQLDIAGFPRGGSYYHFHNGANEGQLVFFGDSYVYQYLMPYFSETFRDVYLFHLPTDLKIMKPILDMIGTDYVVMEMVERTYGITGIELMEEYIKAETPVLTRPEDYPELD